MRRHVLALFMTFSCVVCTPPVLSAQPPAPWSDHPLLIPSGGGREEALFRLQNIGGETLEIFSPVGNRQNVALSNQQARFRADTQGGYHWFQVRDAKGAQVRIASTIRYFANPGPSPETMLATPKSELEIAPDPLPREHQNYIGNTIWPFMIRYEGKPLIGAKVTLTTRDGTKLAFFSNQSGRIDVQFPSFHPVADPHTEQTNHRGGGHTMPEHMPFVLYVQHEANQIYYETAFNGFFLPDHDHSNSLGIGLGFLFLGAALVTPLLRHRPEVCT